MKKIVTIKSKKEVVIDSFKNIRAFPMCEIITFTQHEDGFDANGRYFYEFEQDNLERTIIRNEISSFNRSFTNEQADALFTSLALEFPENSTYSEKRKIEVIVGLLYLIDTEQYWGLTKTDWEVIIEDENE